MMFSAIRSRLTYANVVATLALVFAMSGGALAASHYLITSTKQIKPGVLASLKGKAGANGAPGAQGPAGVNGTGTAGPAGPAGGTGKEGPEGKEGHEGKAGTNGKAGKSVTSTSFTGATEPAGEPCKKAGGSSLEEEGTGTVTYACNGEKGSKGEEGNIKATLAPGATETGTWSFFYTKVGEEYELRHVPISFPIPLAAPLEASGCPSGSECHVHLVKENETGTGECEGGTANTPTAKPGNLCIYEGSMLKAEGEHFYLNPSGGVATTGTTGLLWGVFVTPGVVGSESEGYGSWAVTAE
jgi:hypothetical protein